MKIMLTSVMVDDQARAQIATATVSLRTAEREYERLQGLGVRFTQPPTDMGPVTTAVLDDTCGNLIQISTAA